MTNAPPNPALLTAAAPVADAAVYFPPASGRYEVKPGLVPLGTDLGNGERDGAVFQVDSAWPLYRRAKEAARAERLDKYYQTHDLDAAVRATVCRFIAGQLVSEHPDDFRFADGDRPELVCRRSGERLRFGADWARVEGGPQGGPAYADGLDALATQVQEDLAIVRRRDGRDWTSAIHLCFPHGWTAEAKIGLDFVTMHVPVPGMEKFRRPGMVNVMIDKKPSVRFVWGLQTDARLNHHPQAPAGLAAVWGAVPFDPQQPRLFLRVEREVLWGFPQVEAALFALRVYLQDCAVIRRQPTLCEPLCAALESMDQDLLRYKGLATSRGPILDWLRAG